MDKDDSDSSIPVDHTMHSKYEELALAVKEAVEKQEANRGDPSSSCILWYGIAGGPGSGKSTLAKKVAEICQHKWKIPCLVISTDGYLYSRSDLSKKLGSDERGILDYLRRRGSPHTVDVEQLCNDLFLASGKPQPKQHDFHGVFANYSGPQQMSHEPKPIQASRFAFPEYCRKVPSDPIPKQIQFDPSRHKVVFVEGEFLLLGAEGMIPGYVTDTESKRWKPLIDVFDYTWFLTCQPEQPQLPINEEENAMSCQKDDDGWFDYEIEEQRKRRMRYQTIQKRCNRYIRPIHRIRHV